MAHVPEEHLGAVTRWRLVARTRPRRVRWVVASSFAFILSACGSDSSEAGKDSGSPTMIDAGLADAAADSSAADSMATPTSTDAAADVGAERVDSSPGLDASSPQSDATDSATDGGCPDAGQLVCIQGGCVCVYCPSGGCLCTSNTGGCSAALPYSCNAGSECCNYRPLGC